MTRSLALLALLPFLLATLACGSDGDDVEPTEDTPVEGSITLEDCPLDEAACAFARDVEERFTATDAEAFAALLRPATYTCPEEGATGAPVCFDAQPGEQVEGFIYYGDAAGDAGAVAPVEAAPALVEQYTGARLLSIACPESGDDLAAHCAGEMALVFETDEFVVGSEGSTYEAPPLVLVMLASREGDAWGITGFGGHVVRNDLLLNGGVPEEAAFFYLSHSLTESVFFPVGEPGDQPFVTTGDACRESTPTFDAIACDLITQAEALMAAGSHEELLDLLPPIVLRCADDLATLPICEGQPDDATYEFYADLSRQGEDLAAPEGPGFTREALLAELSTLGPEVTLRTVGCQHGGNPETSPFGPARCDDYITLVFAGSEPGDPRLLAIEVQRIQGPVDGAGFLFDAFPETTLRRGGTLSEREEPAFLAPFTTVHPIEGAYQPPEEPGDAPTPEPSPTTTAFDPGPRPEIDAPPIAGCDLAGDACDFAAAVTELYKSGDPRVASFGRSETVQCPDDFVGGLEDPLSLVCGVTPGDEVEAVPVNFEFLELYHPATTFADFAANFGVTSHLATIGCPEPEGSPTRCAESMALVFEQEAAATGRPEEEYPPTHSILVAERGDDGELALTRILLVRMPRRALINGGATLWQVPFDLPAQLNLSTVIAASELEADACPDPADDFACDLARDVSAALAAEDIDGVFALLPPGATCPLPGGVSGDPCPELEDAESAELFRLAHDRPLPGVEGVEDGAIVRREVIAAHLEAIAGEAELVTIACATELDESRELNNCDRAVSLVFATPRAGSDDPELMIISVGRGGGAGSDVTFAVSSFPGLVVLEGGPVPADVPPSIADFATFFPVE